MKRPGVKVMMRIGVNVGRVRQDLGMTQAEFSKAINMRRGTLGKIETGACFPSVSALIAICRYTKKSPNTILGWWGERIDE